MRENQHFLKSVKDVWSQQRAVNYTKSLIEICGQGRVLIEHHKGVRSYGHMEISINVTYGLVCICGEGLHLRFLSKEKLLITGKIRSITLCEEKEK